MCRIDDAQSIMLILSLINNNNSYDSYTKMTALMKIVIRITMIIVMMIVILMVRILITV